jgi:hypothetical protein
MFLGSFVARRGVPVIDLWRLRPQPRRELSRTPREEPKLRADSRERVTA